MSGTNNELLNEKRSMRDAMQRARMALPQVAMLRASESVARHFADHPILAFKPSFAGYLAMKSEVDILSIFEMMAKYHKQTALPRLTEQKMMHFRNWKLGDPLTRHSFGMQEPEVNAPAMIPSLVLVPLLAFDIQGGRLGYGGGYYDRTMEAMRRFEVPPLFIGVAYSMQEVARVPMGPQDQPLDGVLTELGVSMFNDGVLERKKGHAP